MVMLYDNNWAPATGSMYYVLMFAMTLVLFIIAMWQLVVPMFMKSGFKSDPIGGLTSGADVRFAASLEGPSGTPITNRWSVPMSGFTGPEPPVWWNIGDVDATRAAEQQLINAYPAEGLTPVVGGSRKGGLDPTRWNRDNFSDAALLKVSQGY